MTTRMALYTLVSGKFLFAVIVLFAVIAVLVLHADSQCRELSKAAVTLIDNVNELNSTVEKLKAELEGVNGCKEQVGVILSYS